eukprot:TRINITY_DN173_c0_g2_i1.p1 TRINITY_DN173_c0_g2~~TRINITY_DN173_c0_g2_i1.p1  ORF type:complete len:871 (+),score=351.97 TRINITY_DN173_c0_g2_i1:36-2615(+)
MTKKKKEQKKKKKKKKYKKMALKMNQSFEHVRDESVLQKFLEEKEVTKQLVEVRTELKKLRTEKDTLMKEENPKQKSMLNAFDDKLDQLHREKDVLHGKMQSLTDGDQKSRINRNLIMDRIKLVVFDLEPVERECRSLLGEIESAGKKIETLKKQVTATQSALTHKSHMDIDHSMKALEKKLKSAEEKNHDSVIKQLRKERRQLQQSKDKITAYHTSKTALDEAVKKLSEYETIAIKKAAEKAQLQKDKERLNKELDTKYPVPKPEERDAKDAKKAKINTEINEIVASIQAERAKKDKKMEEFQTGPVREKSQKINAKSEERNVLEMKIRTINEAIPKKTLEVDKNLISDIVGPGGATVRQIEEDFGVVIDVRRMEGEVVIKGSECADCASAVGEILQKAAENRYVEEIEIDPECGGEFIGSGGSQIQLLQTRSGTNINYTRGQGKVVVIGSRENVEAAIELIKEFKANSVRTEVTFGPNAASIMRVSLMKQWQEEYQCRLIKVDQEAKKISIMGKGECVEKAKTEITDFLEGMKECGTVHIPFNVPHHVIIGTKGERVNHIQAETKCILDVSKDTVKIAGSKENIELARKLVNTIIAENVREEVKVPYKAKMHNFLIRRRPVKKTEAEEEQEKEKEEHADPNAKPDRRRDGLCLLEQLRLKYNCDRVQADLPGLTVTIRGPKDAIKKCRDELKAALDFTGMEKDVLMIDQAIVRYLTVNLNQRGARGVRTRLDKVRNIEGVEEVTADFRGESKRVELIGTKEGVAKARETLEDLAEGVAKMMTKFDVEQNKVGRLLGRGGMTVSGIERDFEVMFHIPRTDRSKEIPVDATITVSIIGEDPKAVEEAQSAANNALADYK